MRIIKEKWISYLAYSIAVFGSSFSYLAPLISENAARTTSVFWLGQVTSFVINPQLTLGLSIVNLIFCFLVLSNKRFWPIMGVLLGSLIGIKVYGFVLAITVIGFLALTNYIYRRDETLLKASVFGFFIAVIILLVVGTGSKEPFQFKPGYLVETMFSSNLRLNMPDWITLRDIFRENGQWIKLFAWWMIGFSVFLIGNYGLKILGLLFALIILFKKKNSKRQGVWMAFILISALSIILSSLLVQTKMHWNSVQFMFFAHVPLVGLTVFSLKKVFKKALVTKLLTIILLVSIPSSIISLISDLSVKSYKYYPPALMKSLSKIRKRLSSDNEIIVSSEYNKDSFIPAFLGQSVYYADYDSVLIQYESESVKPNERKKYVEEVFLGQRKCGNNQILIYGPKGRPAIPKESKYIVKNDIITALYCN
jgi:hypothetical protein